MKSAETVLSRRQFCQQSATLGLATASGALVPGQGLAGQKVVSAPGAFAQSFEKVRQSYSTTNIRFRGKLPPALKGSLYRNGPALMARGQTQYRHWFDGDGMMHAFRLGDNQLSHQGVMVQTDRYQAENKAGRYLWDGFGTTFADSKPTSSPDTVNPGNISVLPAGDEVLALWEAGSAWRLHADTLETIGRKVFSEDTDGMPFSAHPRTDPAGPIWNFGYLSGSGKLVLYELSSSASLRRVALIDAPNADMVHDFAITENYLVFVLMPLRFKVKAGANSGQASFLDNLSWDNDDSVKVLLVGKDSLKIEHRFELAPFFAFHLGNAWEDKGDVHVQIAVAPPFNELMQTIVLATTGQPLPNQTPSQAAKIVLRTSRGTARMESLPTPGIEFPRHDQRYTGRRTQHLFMLGRSNNLPDNAFGFNTVTAMNGQSDKHQVFDYGPDILAEEHVFVAAPGSNEGVGWLLGTAYNWRKQQTVLSVFDAQHLGDGPIAQAALPYGLPLGLHGQFVPTT